MPDGNIRWMAYEPRPFQLTIHERLKRFNVLVCHRRFGKTVLALNQLISSALRCTRPDPRFAYIAPQLNQAKDTAWDYLLRYSDPFRIEANIAEHWVKVVGGARIRIYGADNPDNLRGPYLDGVILDEFAQMAPKTWSEVIGPMLADRKGFAIFIGTPKGQNAFYDQYQFAMTHPEEWYATVLKASETEVLDAEELARWKEAMSPEEYEQEFECSFQAANVGAYYGKLMAQAESDKRICKVPWEPDVPVTTAWDLGMDDATAIWFCQQVGREVRVIDYYEASGEALPHYAGVIKSKPYAYENHLLPHDAKVKELGTGLSRVEVLDKLGIRADVVPAQSIEDGINSVRTILPRCWFDNEKCARGIKALGGYQREWADKLGTWRARPRHDWASHGADAFRYYAIGQRPPAKDEPLNISTKWVV